MYSLIKKLESSPVVGLDIETISLKGEGGWVVTPFHVGLYDPEKELGYSILINPYYVNNLTRNVEGLFFYSPEKYMNVGGWVVGLEKARELLSNLHLKKVYGHNIVRFDIPHLQEWGLCPQIKSTYDTYLSAGDALPLKYYDFCMKDKGKFFTEKGNLKMSAEAIYCFLSDNPAFEEAHTALEDAKIEYELYKYMSKRTKAAVEGSWQTILKKYFSRFKFFRD